MRRSRSFTGTGRTASTRASSGGSRPVTERVARWLSSLGQVHRRVRAAGRRSGDLYERVPALLVLSGQQARVDPAAAGEGEVGRGHDRPVLRRPDRERRNQGRYLSFTARGAALQPLLEDHATDAFYVDSTGRKTLASAGGGLTLVKGTSRRSRRRRLQPAGVYFGPVYAPRPLSNPGARSMEVAVREISRFVGSGRKRWQEPESSARYSISG